MRLIPYEKLTLVTSHSPVEIKRRLEAGVGAPRGGGFKALRKPEKLFEGAFDENKFRFWRAIRHTNGFMPIVTGTIVVGKLEVELKWHPFIRIFFPVWTGILIVMGWLVVSKDPANAQCVLSNTPFAIVAFVYAMGIFFYNFYADKAKKFLRDVVK